MNTSSKSVIFNKAAAVFANLSELENSFVAAQQQMEQHKQMMLVIEKSLMETRTKAAEVENEVRALYMPIVVSLPSSPVDTMTPSAFNQAPVASPSPTNLARRMTKEQVAALSKEDKKERNRLKGIAKAERTAVRTPEETARVLAQVAKMQAARIAKRAAGGGDSDGEAAGVLSPQVSNGASV
jgi:hypothetical protein